jgi:hypothetical protein
MRRDMCDAERQIELTMLIVTVVGPCSFFDRRRCSDTIVCTKIIRIQLHDWSEFRPIGVLKWEFKTSSPCRLPQWRCPRFLYIAQKSPLASPVTFPI